jgi:hypothetical protein
MSEDVVTARAVEQLRSRIGMPVAVLHEFEGCVGDMDAMLAVIPALQVEPLLARPEELAGVSVMLARGRARAEVPAQAPAATAAPPEAAAV